MAFNRFSIKVTSQVLLISLVSYLLVWSFQKDYLVVTKFTFLIILILQIFGLIYYVNRTNRTLRNFLQSLRYLDSIPETTETEQSFQDLNVTYNEIIETVRRVNIEKAAEHHYFQLTIEHVGVGLLSFTPSGTVELINQAAKNLLHTDDLRNIKALDRKIAGFSEMLLALKPNRQRLLKLTVEGEFLKLSVRSTVFKISDRTVKLVSIQNIKTELEAEEADAWQKLIRVLTHEIMNSVTPVKSLTGTIIKMLESEEQRCQPGELHYNVIHNVLDGLRAIDKRSKGLLNFVQSYRHLTRIPKPNLKTFSVMDLFHNAMLLMQSEVDKCHIQLGAELQDENLPLLADEKLVMQILINLIKNAIQALNNTPNGEITLKGFASNDGATVIRVTDNGPGISPEFIDKIFIPFYTTKEEGTGIGLSISRQIMLLHGGSIGVQSSPHRETTFSLQF